MKTLHNHVIELNECFRVKDTQDRFRIKAESKKVTHSRRSKNTKSIATSFTGYKEQGMFIEHCKCMEAKYPARKLLFAIANGGQRHFLVAKKSKSEGVKSGVPDIFLFMEKDSSHEFFIKLKQYDTGIVIKRQKEWLKDLIEQGYSCAVCHGWAKAWNVIKEYLNIEKDGKEYFPYVGLEEA